MYSKWTSHLKDEQEQQDFRRQILSSRDVLARQKNILDEEEKNLDLSEMDTKQFDAPNWRERQAFKMGYRSAIHHLKTFIDLDQQETNIERNTSERPLGP